ncbi:hypothetical protein NKG05_16845 [Oerskovia sp. M15]
MPEGEPPAMPDGQTGGQGAAGGAAPAARAPTRATTGSRSRAARSWWTPTATAWTATARSRSRAGPPWSRGRRTPGTARSTSTGPSRSRRDLLAAGSSGMAVAPDADSAQGWVAANLDQTAAAGTVVHLLSDDGASLVSYEVTKDTESVVYSSPEITTGATYVFRTGGTLGTPEAAGLSSTGGPDGATQVATAVAGEFAGGGTGGMGGGRRPGATDSTDTSGDATTSGT